MNIMQVAVVLIRLSALGWFIDIPLAFLSLPSDFYGIKNQTNSYLVTQREIGVVLVLVRALIYGVLGMVFSLYAVPIARVVTKGLESLQTPIHPQDSWPPAPRSVTEQSVAKDA